MFNFDELSVPLSSMDAAGDTALPINQSINQCSDVNRTVQKETAVNNHATVDHSYSSVLARNTQTEQSKQQLSKFRQSMVSDVYIDQRDKDRRATSFIISGLSTSTNCPDQIFFTDLCLNEFNIQIDIANTKRLGNSPSSATPTSKIQPLPVSVKHPDQAKMIISSARQLRHSNVSVIRNNVLINANLTEAEATAAYELRCRRRVTAIR